IGSFEAFLLAVALAGGLQILLGALRAGSIAAFIPSSVIKGLLAAIGLILIMKQLPHLVGYVAPLQGDMALHPEAPTDGGFFQRIHWGAGVIGLFSIAVLLLWDRSKMLKKSIVPGPLVVVLSAVALSFLFEKSGSGWPLGARQLVQVPVAESLGGFLGFLKLPDFSGLLDSKIYVAAVTIAVVASLETLLNLEAVDRLDPQKRISPPNRELLAQGAGNLVAGLLGGLPITSVIVRSSVNINAGARTRISGIVHGVLLLGCVALLPGWLNRIPLSCLAAILVATGVKLASPKLFAQMWRNGLDQFLPFAVTVTAILATDLLIGIVIGLAFSILFILRSNLRSPLRRVIEQHVGGEVLHVKLANQVSFLNRVALLKTFDEVPRGGNLLIDASETDYIDADVLGLIREFQSETAPARGIQVSLAGFQDDYGDLSDRTQYIDLTTRELQALLSPDQVLTILKAGNERFCSGETLSRDLVRHRGMVADSRHPLAVVLSGASSRTPVELIFDVGLGDLVCTRVAGNIPCDEVLGTIEYACLDAGASLVIVMGHTANSLVRLAVEEQVDSRDHVPQATCLPLILKEIQQSIDPARLQGWTSLSQLEQLARIDEFSRRHVQRMADRVGVSTPAIRERFRDGRLRIIGAMYDLRSGRVEFLEPLNSPPSDSTTVRQRT
ncbi:MAG: sulfate transporter, partial [Planctomycetaceae bacterium]